MVRDNVKVPVDDVEEVLGIVLKTCATPKRRRVSVIDSIKKSIQQQSSTSPVTNKEKARKSLQFLDHAYSSKLDYSCIVSGAGPMFKKRGFHS